jgi:hypothetical protein
MLSLLVPTPVVSLDEGNFKSKASVGALVEFYAPW